MGLLAQLQTCHAALENQAPTKGYVQEAARAHGDRLRYKAGCRCDRCCEANTQYAKERQQARSTGQWNGIVSAEPARAHLCALAKHGLSRSEICEVTHLSHESFNEISTGGQANIRASTERQILAISKEAPDQSYVDAKASCALIDLMIESGFTKQRIATEFGGSIAEIGRHEKITVSNARRIREIHERLLSEEAKRVSSALSLRLIEELRTEYYKTPQIARELGIAPEELATIGAQVTAEFESLVKLVHAHLMR